MKPPGMLDASMTRHTNHRKHGLQADAKRQALACYRVPHQGASHGLHTLYACQRGMQHKTLDVSIAQPAESRWCKSQQGIPDSQKNVGCAISKAGIKVLPHNDHLLESFACV